MAYAEFGWSPPEYPITQPPHSKTKICLKDDPLFPQNFARTAKWSPDGSVFLVQCENRTFEIFSPQDERRTSDVAAFSAPHKSFPQPAPILDFAWYPSATPHDPASFCFIASVRECPVKLLDAADGRLRASYKIVDHRERQVAPHSLAFNLSAQKLYCGFEDAIEVFDVSLPGEGTRLQTTPSRKSKDGLKGIVSALAFAPSHASDLYAAGSLSPTPSNIALFSEEQGSNPVMFVGGGPRAGVTQIQFNPTRPHIMYASYRRHGSIYSWDLRTNVETPFKIYQPEDEDAPVTAEGGHTLGDDAARARSRSKRTNQKLRFDVDIGGARLGVGDHLGNVSIFDLEETDLLTEWNPTGGDAGQSGTPDGVRVKPSLKFAAHGDAIGAVAFNQSKPTLLTVSGSRHFDEPTSTDEEDEEEEGRGRAAKRNQLQPYTLDSSIKIWEF